MKQIERHQLGDDCIVLFLKTDSRGLRESEVSVERSQAILDGGEYLFSSALYDSVTKQNGISHFASFKEH